MEGKLLTGDMLKLYGRKVMDGILNAANGKFLKESDLKTVGGEKLTGTGDIATKAVWLEVPGIDTSLISKDDPSAEFKIGDLAGGYSALTSGEAQGVAVEKNRTTETYYERWFWPSARNISPVMGKYVRSVRCYPPGGAVEWLRDVTPEGYVPVIEVRSNNGVYLLFEKQTTVYNSAYWFYVDLDAGGGAQIVGDDFTAAMDDDLCLGVKALLNGSHVFFSKFVKYTNGVQDIPGGKIYMLSPVSLNFADYAGNGVNQLYSWCGMIDDGEAKMLVAMDFEDNASPRWLDVNAGSALLESGSLVESTVTLEDGIYTKMTTGTQSYCGVRVNYSDVGYCHFPMGIKYNNCQTFCVSTLTLTGETFHVYLDSNNILHTSANPPSGPRPPRPTT